MALPFETSNQDQTFKNLVGTQTPEDLARSNEIENNPDVIQSGLNDIANELKKPQLDPAAKADLLSSQKELQGRLSSTSLPFETKSLPFENNTGGGTQLPFESSSGLPFEQPHATNTNTPTDNQIRFSDVAHLFSIPEGETFESFGKKVASSGAKLADMALSVPAMATAYAGAGIKGFQQLMSPGYENTLDVMKDTKDRLMHELSIDQQLQAHNLAKDNPNPLVTAIANPITNASQSIANTVTQPGTFQNEALRDTLMFGIPLAGHKAMETMTGHQTDLIPITSEEKPSGTQGVQGQLFPEHPEQAGPIPEKAPTINELPANIGQTIEAAKQETPVEQPVTPLSTLINQAKEEVVPAAQSEQPALPEQAKLPLEEPKQLDAMLSNAGKDINSDNPSVEQLSQEKSRPLVMPPDELFQKFNINPDNIETPTGFFNGLNSPIWKRRELWEDNPILRNVLDNTRELSDRINATARTAIERGSDEHPLLNLKSLDPAERIQFAKLSSMYDGHESDFGGNHFTKDEWISKGATPKVANALIESGHSYDVALDLINQGRRSTGLPDIERIPNYMPHQFGYPFRTEIINKATGEKRISSHPTLAEARQVAEAIQKNLPKDGNFAVDYKRNERGSGNYTELVDQLREQSNKFKGEEPSPFHKMMDSLYDKMNQAFLGATKERQGEMQYTGSHKFTMTNDPAKINRYAKDADFISKLPEKSVYDAAGYTKKLQLDALKKSYQQAALDAGVAHTQAWQSLSKIIDKHMESYTEPLFQSGKVTLPERIADGFASSFDKTSIPGHVPQSFLSPRALVDLTRGFGRVMLASKISPTFNLGLLPVQYLQPILSPLNLVGTASRMVAKNTGNSILDQAGALGKTPMQVASAATKAMFDTITHQVDHKLGMTNATKPQAEAALQWARSRGHLDSILSQEHGTFQEKITRAVTQQALTEHAEQTPRSVAFLNGYYIAKNLGFPEGAARRTAVDAMNEVMGDYSKEGKPAVVRELNPIAGTVVSQLSTYMLNTLNQLHSIGRGATTNQFVHNTVIPALTFLGVSYALTGWGGMPGVRDYDDVVKWVNDNFKTGLPTSFEINMRLHDPKIMTDDEANKAYYGLASEATGRDLAKSARSGNMFGFGTFIPSQTVSVGKSAYYEAKNLLAKTGAVEPPTEEQMYRSRKDIAPPSMQFMVEDAYAKQKPEGEILKEGILRKPGESETRYVNPFESLEEKKQRDVNNAANYYKQRQDLQTSREMELITDKANRHEDFTANIRNLVDLNPDYARNPSVMEAIIQNQIKRNLTQQEFEALHAASGTSLNAMQDAARRAEFMKKVMGSK